MGTFVSISIFDDNISEIKLTSAFLNAFRAIDRIESITSRHIDSSEINNVNQNADENWISIDSTLYRVIHSGLDVAEITNGCFDPTIAPILDLWKFGETQPQKPEINKIKNSLSLVNFQNVQLETSQIKFSQKKMAIDLGGIAKGAAIDAAANQLKKIGIKDFMIDAGGDLAICSSKLTQGKIRVWIRHPRKPEILFGYFYLDKGFVATSGDYEQYFEDDGHCFHHIINPKTGFPDSDLISVTVIAKTAELADAYSTGIFVMGRENGIRFVKNHPELEAVLLSKRKEKINYWASESIMEKIHIVDDSIL